MEEIQNVTAIEVQRKKRNKSPKRKGKIKVQREKGNKSPNKNWKK